MLMNISPRVQKEIIGKHRQYINNLNKIQKYSIFFHFSKHLKQQEHQINTLLHKYGKKTDI